MTDKIVLEKVKTSVQGVTRCSLCYLDYSRTSWPCRECEKYHVYHIEDNNHGWISVKDALPEDNSNVLVCHYYCDGVDLDTAIAWYGATKDLWFAGTEMLEAENYDGGATIRLDTQPTHWQPLPNPPEGIV